MTNGRVENIDVLFGFDKLVDLIFNSHNVARLKTFYFLHKLYTFLFQLGLVYYIFWVLAIIFLMVLESFFGIVSRETIKKNPLEAGISVSKSIC